MTLPAQVDPSASVQSPGVKPGKMTAQPMPAVKPLNLGSIARPAPMPSAPSMPGANQAVLAAADKMLPPWAKAAGLDGAGYLNHLQNKPTAQGRGILQKRLGFDPFGGGGGPMPGGPGGGVGGPGLAPPSGGIFAGGGSGMGGPMDSPVSFDPASGVADDPTDGRPPGAWGPGAEAGGAAGGGSAGFAGTGGVPRLSPPPIPRPQGGIGTVRGLPMPVPSPPGFPQGGEAGKADMVDTRMAAPGWQKPGAGNQTPGFVPGQARPVSKPMTLGGGPGPMPGGGPMPVRPDPRPMGPPPGVGGIAKPFSPGSGGIVNVPGNRPDPRPMGPGVTNTKPLNLGPVGQPAPPQDPGMSIEQPQEPSPMAVDQDAMRRMLMQRMGGRGLQDPAYFAR